jgi:streptogrisin C
MIGTKVKRGVTAAFVGVVVVGLMPATAAQARGEGAADGGSTLAATVSAYQRSYPSMSLSEARAAANGQDDRKAVVAEVIKRHGDSFGGAWYDPPSGILHIATTTAAATARVKTLSSANNVRFTVHAVKRTFAELERQADALRAGAGELGRAAQGKVGIDVTTNQVTVALPAGTRVAGVPDGVKVVVDPQIRTEEDAGCTARDACDWTIRAGAMLWDGFAGNNVCSVGFTARNASNQRVVYTAGHCSSGAGVTWGTGALPIGPMGVSQNAGAVDGAIISVTNSWFTGDLGGEIYIQGGTFSMPVKGVAPTLSYIVAGETVCLAANYTQPTGSNFCGTVGTNSDAAVRGMVRVDGLDACGGDSGGGWYWLPSSGNRYAYGIHSRSDPGCHGDQSGTRSWFSAVPTVKAAIAPAFNVELR